MGLTPQVKDETIEAIEEEQLQERSATAKRPIEEDDELVVKDEALGEKKVATAELTVWDLVMLNRKVSTEPRAKRVKRDKDAIANNIDRKQEDPVAGLRASGASDDLMALFTTAAPSSSGTGGGDQDCFGKPLTSSPRASLLIASTPLLQTLCLVVR